MNISYNDLLDTFENILMDEGFTQSDAEECSEIFAENTLVGVSSHGVNRFPSFINLIRSGHIKPKAKPSIVNSFNALEQWDGNLGPGPLCAKAMMKRAIEISDEFGIGLVALKNSNHWMRPGYYAWEAANKGYLFICWTNTIPIMPPWGGKEATIGNNPIVFGVPREEGNIVLDMALSQYSYGKLATYRRENKELPYHGGYDNKGKLSKNAAEIYSSQRPLPIGYWKGSGLSLLLDLFAAILSGGKSTYDLGKSEVDSGMSQIYISINPKKFNSKEIYNQSVSEIVQFYLSSEMDENNVISYPGERIFKNKAENLKNGVEVSDEIWQKIKILQEKQ